MLKWMFVRMEEPHASPGPSWHYTDPAWPPEDALQARGTIINPDAYCPAVAEANWDWLRGCWQSGRTSRPHTAATRATTRASAPCLGAAGAADAGRLQAALALRWAGNAEQLAAAEEWLAALESEGPGHRLPGRPAIARTTTPAGGDWGL